MYFSDGAASQYINKKNFINLAYHNSDFQLQAEWHFFVSAHGKGPCDGVGGTLKRLASRASLQRPYTDQLTTPQQLFEWAAANITNITFSYVSQQEYEQHLDYLQIRFGSTTTIKGTRKLHAFIQVSDNHLTTKEYSFSQETKLISY